MKNALGPVELLILQGSPFCNIDCKYCYLSDRLSKKKISLDTVKRTFERLIDDNLLASKLSVIWHAGEPLAVPLNYYKEIFKTINDTVLGTTKLNYHIQTNGMLIDQAWCDFIKEHDIRVGVSVDGPKHINDFYRLSRTGKSTFDKVMNGIDLLKQNDISYHVIAVVTNKSLEYPKEIYRFFEELGVDRLCLNIEETEGPNMNSSLANTQDVENKVYSFFEVMNDLEIDSKKKLFIRELEDAKSKVLEIPLNYFSQFDFSQQTKPYRIISIDTDGNFSTFSPELLGQKSDEYNDFVLGNVHNISFKEAATQHVFNKIFEDIRIGVEKCEEECQYFPFCGGGAPSNKYYENGTFNSTETQYCKQTIQTPLNVVIDRIEKEIKPSHSIA